MEIYFQIYVLGIFVLYGWHIYDVAKARALNIAEPDPVLSCIFIVLWPLLAVALIFDLGIDGLAWCIRKYKG